MASHQSDMAGFEPMASHGAFTGRTREVAQVLNAVGQSPTGLGWKVFAFDGEPGVGKTTLALYLYHRLSGHFTHRFYVDLHSHTAGQAPAKPVEVLRGQLSFAGRNVAEIAEDERQLSAAWRAHLAGGPSILLLDNAKDVEQVRPLLPGKSDCLVLITSRLRLIDLRDDPRVELMPVGPFDDASAVELAERITDREFGDEERQAVLEMASLSGHLPLAIAVFAARLADQRAGNTAAGLLARLKRASSTLAGLERLTVSQRRLTPLFEMSYEGLPQYQGTMRRLALVPGTNFDGYAAAAVTATAYDDANAHLLALADNSLLANEGAFFKMHDLFRDYMKNKARLEDTDQIRLDALNRLVGYYQHTAALADRYLARHARPSTAEIGRPDEERHFEDRDEALRWLRAELENYLTCLDEAVLLRQDRWVVGLTASISAFLRNEGLWQKAEDLHQRALDAAICLDDKVAEANVLSELGLIHRLMGKFSTAKDEATKALDIYRSIGERLGEANALSDIALLINLERDNEGSVRLFQQALGIYAGLGHRLGEANVSNDLGFTLRTAGRKREAVVSFERAGELFGKLDNKLGLAHALYLRGATLREIVEESDRVTRLDQATVVLAQALDLYRELGNLLGKANVLTHLGGVQRASGQLDRAFENLDEALAIHGRIVNRRGEADAHRELGAAYAARGDVATAIDHLEQSLALYGALGLAAADEVASELAKIRSSSQ